MKRRQEEAEAEERARKEAEEAERRSAVAAAQAVSVPEQQVDRPDASSPVAEDRPGNFIKSTTNLTEYLILTSLHFYI